MGVFLLIINVVILPGMLEEHLGRAIRGVVTVDKLYIIADTKELMFLQGVRTGAFRTAICTCDRVKYEWNNTLRGQGWSGRLGICCNLPQNVDSERCTSGGYVKY